MRDAGPTRFALIYRRFTPPKSRIVLTFEEKNETKKKEIVCSLVAQKFAGHLEHSALILGSIKGNL